MHSKFKKNLLVLFVPVILLVLTACPGLIDNIRISFDIHGAIAHAVVTFTCISPVSGNVLSYSWEFGDGNSATGQTVSHKYQLGGTYVVECHVITPSSVLILTKSLIIASGATIGTLPIIDLFTEPLSTTVPCDDPPTTVVDQLTDTVAFGSRTLNTNGFNGDSTDLTVNIGGGTYSFSLAAGPGPRCIVDINYPIFDTSSPETFDASAFTGIAFDVNSVTETNGAVDCNVTLNFESAVFLYVVSYAISSSGPQSMNFAAFTLPLPSDMNSIRLQCVPNPGESIEIENLRLIP